MAQAYQTTSSSMNERERCDCVSLQIRIVEPKRTMRQPGSVPELSSPTFSYQDLAPLAVGEGEEFPEIMKSDTKSVTFLLVVASNASNASNECRRKRGVIRGGARTYKVHTASNSHRKVHMMIGTLRVFSCIIYVLSMYLSCQSMSSLRMSLHLLLRTYVHT